MDVPYGYENTDNSDPEKTLFYQILLVTPNIPPIDAIKRISSVKYFS